MYREQSLFLFVDAVIILGFVYTGCVHIIRTESDLFDERDSLIFRSLFLPFFFFK